MSEAERKKLFGILDSYQNPEVGQIVKLMLLTAMRRSEAVLLKWSQIKENHIELLSMGVNVRSLEETIRENRPPSSMNTQADI